MPFESALKALWPKNYVDKDGNVYPPEKNPILFLSTSAEDRYGHGDTPVPAGNGGFLRNDPVKGLSLIAIIIVSDEEDCSTKDDSHFRSTNDPSDPLSKQGINLRCFAAQGQRKSLMGRAIEQTRDPAGAACQQLQRFIALWTPDVMGYKDLNRYALRYRAPQSKYERAINRWCEQLE